MQQKIHQSLAMDPEFVKEELEKRSTGEQDNGNRGVINQPYGTNQQELIEQCGDVIGTNGFPPCEEEEASAVSSITLLGDNPLTVSVAGKPAEKSDFVDPGYTATGPEGQNYDDMVIVSSNIPALPVRGREYQVAYTLPSINGNPEVVEVRTVTFIVIELM